MRGSNLPQEVTTEVMANRPRGGGYHVLRLVTDDFFPVPAAGAFVMLSAGREPEILLRRPMAIYDISKSRGRTTIDILYAVMGKGTSELTKRVPGETLSLLGPLGNSFERPAPAQKVFVVAGGVGIAPFLLWCKQLTKSQQKQSRLLFGFRDRSQIPILGDFKRAGVQVRVAVEKGAGGVRGTAIDLLSKEIEKEGRPDLILTCGPKRMMERVGEIAGSLDIRLQLSLEAKMACGMGVCLSCVLEESLILESCAGSLVCRDGPVFTVQADGGK